MRGCLASLPEIFVAGGLPAAAQPFPSEFLNNLIKVIIVVP